MVHQRQRGHIQAGELSQPLVLLPSILHHLCSLLVSLPSSTQSTASLSSSLLGSGELQHVSASHGFPSDERSALWRNVSGEKGGGRGAKREGREEVGREGKGWESEA
eukprot:758263-Hanusia_phi.AAC.2